MDGDVLGALERTAARIAELDEVRAGLVDVRDDQVVAALAAGSTWSAVEAASGLSRRGVKLAVDRMRSRGN